MKSSENHKSMLNFQNVMEKVLSAYSETVIYTDFIYIYTHAHNYYVLSLYYYSFNSLSLWGRSRIKPCFWKSPSRLS